MKKRFVVDKQESTYTSDITETETETEQQYSYDESDQEGGGKFQSITNSNYKKPAVGSRQDHMTKEEIKKKLAGYLPLKTMDEKKMLTKMTPFKTWVRYINTDTKQFRTGGLLMKVSYPDYIMLVNTAKNLTWSVQLSDNIIFVRNPQNDSERQRDKQKEKDIKDRLYEMYKNGQLQTKRK